MFADLLLVCCTAQPYAQPNQSMQARSTPRTRSALPPVSRLRATLPLRALHDLHYLSVHTFWPQLACITLPIAWPTYSPLQGSFERGLLASLVFTSLTHPDRALAYVCSVICNPFCTVHLSLHLNLPLPA